MITSKSQCDVLQLIVWSSLIRGLFLSWNFFDLPIGGHKNIAEVLSDDSRAPLSDDQKL